MNKVCAMPKIRSPHEQPFVEVYQLRICLREISPAIWRRLLVRSDSSIEDLHYAIQIAMGWTDSHLHQFVIYGKRYGLWKEGGLSFADDPQQVHLADLGLRLSERFLYEYDFGDLWQHEIRIEKRLPLDRKKPYPVCIGGARQTPLEDCGGPWIFLELRQHYSSWYIAERLLDILEQAHVSDYRGELQTLSYWLNVDKFDRRAVNRRLQQYATGNDDWQWI